jgi:hypothetical protein
VGDLIEEAHLRLLLLDRGRDRELFRDRVVDEELGDGLRPRHPGIVRRRPPGAVLEHRQRLLAGDADAPAAGQLRAREVERPVLEREAALHDELAVSVEDANFVSDCHGDAS